MPETDLQKITPQREFEFWVDYTPMWIDLLEMFEETKEQRYLDGALIGARLYANYVWLQPRVPATNVTVNPGGKTFFGAFAPRRIAGSHAIEVPEQSVPAWRVSQIGLTPEAASTYLGNPAIFLTTHAPPFLRLAQATGDNFFRELARSAVVGRCANFPGYSIKGEYTTVYSRPDFPLRPWVELTYNNIYYNHIWPQIAMVADYLITDAITRSQGRIDFPARYNEGYAYLKGKVYGDRPGSFYDDQDVRLWIPAKLLRTDTIQANYIAGYGNGNCYLALMNQSSAPITAQIVLNPDIVPLDAARTYSVRIWRENQAAASTTMQRGEVRVPIAAQGITALAIDGLQIAPAFQSKVFAADAVRLSAESHAEVTTPFGKATGMLISFGKSLTSSYVWLAATEEELKEARLHYRTAGEWKMIVDAKYPFEFSLPLLDQDLAFEFWREGLKPDGTLQRSEVVTLKR